MGPCGFLKALTLSLRTAWWLPGGCVGWIPRVVGFLWVDGPHTGRRPAFIPDLNESIGQRAEAGKRWGTVSIRMSVGGRGGKDHPHFSSQGSVSATWPISKNSLTLEAGICRVKCRRDHTPIPHGRPNSPAQQPRAAPRPMGVGRCSQCL